MKQQSKLIGKLRETILDEIFKALGMSPEYWLSRLLEPLVWMPAHRFAELGAKFDEYVANSNFCEAARWVLPRFVQNIEVKESENIPAEGPLLIAANHPGTYDVLAIAASLPRPDLKIIASARPFITGLPSTARHLIYTTLNSHERMTVIRAAIRHLKENGALLIFPGGNIEPDPAVLPGAEESLASWSPSLEIMLRRVPQTKVLVAIVSGVLSPECLRSPLTRLHQQLRDRQRAAEFIQVIQQMLFGQKYELTPKITFGKLFTTSDLAKEYGASGMIQAVIDKARGLLTQVPIS
jgi:hypothetical protein